MEVSSGASWSTTVGMRQWSISLNENDGAQLFKGWADADWPSQLKMLQKRADLLVVKYMMEQGAISEEFAKQRAEEIAHAV